ncbi:MULTISPECIES: hypothetical protein [unclassified Crossiella]|uniref:hypothetical protein n=1 Tax=unclassified Crossiella TaxID=2620835 RepID=UPI001FFF3DDB|nr:MULTISPECIES: hypothetical protein [unclassified Crossiella]MCK2240931.1 hypothetical protein [Crossiella sp. S99.2]MCK2253925.1 hypothetical protein [Crossiella sp. S99.1]
MSLRTVLFGLLLGLLIPGGAQWHAQRFLAGAHFLACALCLGVFAYPRFGWITLMIIPVLALIEQVLWWHTARAQPRA